VRRALWTLLLIVLMALAGSSDGLRF